MINLTVNGKSYSVNVSNDTPLLWVLRDTLGLTGTKYGCGIEACGACTVLIDGEPVCACLISVGQADGRAIETIEGLSDSEAIVAQLRAALHAHGAVQCGL